jgi:hypothetical protein
MRRFAGTAGALRVRTIHARGYTREGAVKAAGTQADIPSRNAVPFNLNASWGPVPVW